MLLRRWTDGSWTIRIPIWLQLTFFVLFVAFLSLLIMIIVTGVKSWDYGAALMGEKLASFAAMKAVEIEQSISASQFDVSWTLSRDAVTQNLYSIQLGNVSTSQWSTMSRYLNAMISSKTGYQAIVIYDTNMTQVYSLEHSDSSSSLTSLLAAMSELLPLQDPTTVNTQQLLTTGLLNNPVAIVNNGKTISYSLSITLPITTLVPASLDDVASTRYERLLGYGTVVLSASYLQDLSTDSSASYVLGTSTIVFAEAGHNGTDAGYQYIFPVKRSSCIFCTWPSFPALQIANRLPTNAAAEKERGYDLRTYTSLVPKASVGYSFSTVLQRRWVVGVVISQAAAYADVRHLRNKVIGTCCGILGAVFLIIVPVGRGFTRPLYEIYNGMELRPSGSKSAGSGTASHGPDPKGPNGPNGTNGPHGAGGIRRNKLSPDVSTEVEKDSEIDEESATSTIAVVKTSQREEFHIPSKLPKLRRRYHDELDDLVFEYNAMIDQLSNQYMFLEDQVRSRTQEAQEARILAENANNAKSKFIANITHELRTPLNGIMGMTSISLSEQNMGKIRNNLQVILESGRVLMELLNELLAFSKNQIDMKPEVSEFSPNELLANLDSMFRARTDAKNLSITMIAAPPELGDVRLRGDSYRMLQIMVNFMSNAVKFSDDRGVVAVVVSIHNTPDAHMSTEPYKDTGRPLEPPLSMLEISVTDAGIGITESQMARIFEPFTQGDESLSKRHEGTGLGMSMSKQLAEGIGGYVTVASMENFGSRVGLRVPVQVVDAGLAIEELETAPQQFNSVEVLKTTSLDAGVVRREVPRRAHLRRPTLDLDMASLSDSSARASRRTKNGSLRSRFGFSDLSNANSASTAAPPRLIDRSRPTSVSSTPTPDVLDGNGALRPPVAPALRGGHAAHVSVASAPELGSSHPSVHSVASVNHSLETTPSATSYESAEAGLGPNAAGSVTSSAAGSVAASAVHSRAASVAHSRTPSVVAASHRLSGGTPDAAGPSSDIPTLAPPIIITPTRSTHTHTASHSGSSSGNMQDDVSAMEADFTSRAHNDIKVLVADDNQLNLEILTRMLQRLGVSQVDTASDGETVIKLVEKSIKDGVHYSIIFMDLVMPRVNGLEAAQVIRTNLGYPYPIVALTGYSDEQTAEMCKAAAIQEVLCKPVMRPALIRVLAKYE